MKNIILILGLFTIPPILELAERFRREGETTAHKYDLGIGSI